MVAAGQFNQAGKAAAFIYSHQGVDIAVRQLQVLIQPKTFGGCVLVCKFRCALNCCILRISCSKQLL